METKLSRKLIYAREMAGLSLYQAAARMPNTSYQTIWHLEGRAKDKEPAGGPDVKLKTAVDIVTTYWPAIQLDDFIPECDTIHFEHIRP